MPLWRDGQAWNCGFGEGLGIPANSRGSNAVSVHIPATEYGRGGFFLWFGGFFLGQVGDILDDPVKIQGFHRCSSPNWGCVSWSSSAQQSWALWKLKLSSPAFSITPWFCSTITTKPEG